MKPLIRKIEILICVFALAASCAACGGHEPTETAQIPSGATLPVIGPEGDLPEDTTEATVPSSGEEQTEAVTTEPAATESESVSESGSESASETETEPESTQAVSETYPTEYNTSARITYGTNGHIICIDAGHQEKANSEQEPVGPGSEETKAKVSTGTKGKWTEVPEYVVNLDVALKLEEELIARGYTVLMVRTTHDVNISNVERAEMANEIGADAFIRIHCNGTESEKVKGCGAVCQSKTNPYVGDMFSTNFSLNNKIVNMICEQTGQDKYGVIAEDNMAGINWCKVPAALIELGFMTNEEEDKLLVTEEYQELAAKGIANGIDAWLAVNSSASDAGDDREMPANAVGFVTEGTNGYVIAIDAGHQEKANTEQEPVGPGASETKAKVSSGTYSRFNGTPEYKVNLEVAVKLREVLLDRGYTVIMIRTGHAVNISNVERAGIANEANADAFIRIHCNGSDDPSVHGIGIYYQTPNNPYNGALHDKAKALNLSLLTHMVTQTGARSDGLIESDIYSGINWCEVPAGLVEIGYMTNQEEDANLQNEDYQMKLAVGMADGIDEFLNRKS